MTETCKWRKNGFHMAEHNFWETSCDNLFQFNNDGPKENHFVYCPYCGKEIKIIAEEPEDEDD
jgi:rRNA maturation endonuclease Nob1